MPMRYAHTCIVAKDWKALSLFYQQVFGCKPLSPEREFHGEWIDKLTGIKKVRLTRIRLAFPGYKENGPLLEITSYNTMDLGNPKLVNLVGLSHIAFEVEDMVETLRKVLSEGGSALGELVRVVSPEGQGASLIYVKDPEGNIIELKSRK